jgi:hypothetical protein
MKTVTVFVNVGPADDLRKVTFGVGEDTPEEMVDAMAHECIESLMELWWYEGEAKGRVQ